MRIGYYAHHHGSGHCRQADKLAALLPLEYQQQLTVFTSLAADAYRFITITEAQIVRLSAEDEQPDEVLTGRAGQYWQPDSLHYSPVSNTDIQTRSWQILDTIQRRQIELMIIDVSAEIAMLCRVASVPYLYVRLAGIRDDAPHISAFSGALGLLAPYPPVLEALMTPDWVCQKTLYLGFLPASNSEPLAYETFIQMLTTLTTDATVLDGLRAFLQHSIDVKKEEHTPLLITVIKGYGGHDAIDAKLPELRCALPHAFIISLGPINDDRRGYVDMVAHVADVTPFIAHSDWLLMACGLNGIAQAYDYPTPLVVLPDSRPHQEQEVMAEALIAQGRALSWQQFMSQIVEGKIQNISSAYMNNEFPNAKYKRDNVSHSSAQAFIDSVATYSCRKLWFQNWLLPQIGLTLEKQYKNKNDKRGNNDNSDRRADRSYDYSCERNYSCERHHYLLWP